MAGLTAPGTSLPRLVAMPVNRRSTGGDSLNDGSGFLHSIGFDIHRDGTWVHGWFFSITLSI